MRLRVGVIGCGSAGPAAALLLARAGHEVEVFERAPALGPVGTGFLLQPTGTWVLERLGLREAVESHGARVDSLFCRTRGGRTLLDLHYAGLGAGGHGLGMHRATLLHFLAAALADERVPLHCGVGIVGSEASPQGRWLRTGGGERRGPFDLVVVANGARSEARDWTGIPYRARTYPWGALWAIAPDGDGRFAGRLFQVVRGARTMLGFLPTGTRVDDPARRSLVSLFWSVRGDGVAAVRERGADALTAAIERLVPDAAPLLAQVASMEHWAFAEYQDVVMARWHGDRCVLLGDAAHATSPQLGQGVNLALWDAWVLARCIDEGSALPDALARYTEERRAHLAFYQRASRWLTPLFQSSVPLAGALRDLVFPALGAIPPLRRQMLRSMAGLKRGLLRSSIQLSRLSIQRD